MTEQELKERREAIRVAIDKVMLRAVGNSWAIYETDNILKELSSLGVVIADKDYESWLQESAKTHSLLEEK